MNTLVYLRQFHIMDYAIFDIVVSFLGIYLLSPTLSKLFLKLKIDIPKQNWIFLTLPASILFHLLFLTITPMTANFLYPYGYYGLKIIIIGSLILGLRGIKIVKKQSN